MSTQTEKDALSYRGKHFTLPALEARGFEIVADASKNTVALLRPEDSPVIADLNSIWDTKRFMVPRRPVSLGLVAQKDQSAFSTPGVPRTLDLPIKFPGSSFRIPAAFEQFRAVIEQVAHYEAAVNPTCFDEYYCYLTVDQGMVQPGALQREAPCHVDGFQGARWSPKVRLNHTYTVGDTVPTSYYVQPFDFSQLDEAKHNFFWEMNRQVALTNSAHQWCPEPFELTLMDAYCVHRGSEALVPTFRTWVRLSFEVRKFDRLGNAHNPLFQYDWEMLPRDIEGLGLVAFDESGDPSLRIFPWQKPDGSANEGRVKTKPSLKRTGD